MEIRNLEYTNSLINITAFTCCASIVYPRFHRGIYYIKLLAQHRAFICVYRAHSYKFKFRIQSLRWIYLEIRNAFQRYFRLGLYNFQISIFNLWFKKKYTMLCLFFDINSISFVDCVRVLEVYLFVAINFNVSSILRPASNIVWSQY